MRESECFGGLGGDGASWCVAERLVPGLDRRDAPDRDADDATGVDLTDAVDPEITVTVDTGVDVVCGADGVIDIVTGGDRSSDASSTLPNRRGNVIDVAGVSTSTSTSVVPRTRSISPRINASIIRARAAIMLSRSSSRNTLATNTDPNAVASASTIDSSATRTNPSPYTA